MSVATFGLNDLERMASAVEKVRERLLRAAQALETAGVSYAIIGGNAVAAWVSRVDEAAVRNTRDVDILLRRSDLAPATAALATAGFVYRHVGGMDIFLDGEGAKVRDALHIVWAGEFIGTDAILPAPDVEDSVADNAFRVVSLEALVKMKLTAWRDKDRTHLRDLIDLELIDASWLTRLDTPLAERLQQLLDTPEG